MTLDMQFDVVVTSSDVDVALMELTTASPLDSISVDFPRPTS